MKDIQTSEVYLCNICKGELRQGQNDYDSFDICDNCGLDTFLNSKLKPISATKQVITTIETSYIYHR